MNSLNRFSVLGFLLVVLGLTAACGPAGTPTGIPVQEDQAGIIGGRKVKKNSLIFKHTVAIYDSKKHSTCSGTLISRYAVLTAAHCIPDDTSKMFVVFATKMRNASTAEKRKVAKAVRHPEYNTDVASLNSNDLGVIFLESEAPNTHLSADLLTNFDLVKEKARLKVAGYGVAWSWGLALGTGTLREEALEVRSIDYSETEFLINLSMKGANCSGDSGGPAFLELNHKLYLVGVTSRGDSLPFFPDCILFSVMTRVDPYIDWIRGVLSEGFVTRVRAPENS